LSRPFLQKFKVESEAPFFTDSKHSILSVILPPPFEKICFLPVTAQSRNISYLANPDSFSKVAGSSKSSKYKLSRNPLKKQEKSQRAPMRVTQGLRPLK